MSQLEGWAAGGQASVPAAISPGSCFSATLVICPPTPSAWQHITKASSEKVEPRPRESKPQAWVTQQTWGLYPILSHDLSTPQFPQL